MLVLVLASLAPLPPATGQTQTGSATVDLTLPTLAAPVSPAEVQNTSATVRYQWEQGVSQDNVTIQLAYEDGPEWLNSSFSPAEVEIDLGNNPSGVRTKIVNVTLDVSPQATAFTPGEATYSARAEQTDTLPSAETSESLDLQAGFAGELLADLPRGNVTAWGGVLEEIPIELENTANGPIEVDVRVDRKPADARATAPETLVVGHEAGNATRTATLEMRVPWSLSLDGQVELALTAEHAEEGTELADRQLGFHLEGRSAVPVPSPGPWVTLLAAGLALLARARSRRAT